MCLEYKRLKIYRNFANSFDVLAGKNVAVLGGGMAAAQLAVGALKRGAHHVTLISRRCSYSPLLISHQMTNIQSQLSFRTDNIIIL